MDVLYPVGCESQSRCAYFDMTLNLELLRRHCVGAFEATVSVFSMRRKICVRRVCERNSDRSGRSSLRSKHAVS